MPANRLRFVPFARLQEFERMNSYAWDALGRGQEISLQAGPSQAEKLHKCGPAP